MEKVQGYGRKLRVDILPVWIRGDKEWRWMAEYPKGNCVSTCAESYVKRSHTVRMARNLFPLARIFIEGVEQ